MKGRQSGHRPTRPPSGSKPKANLFLPIRCKSRRWCALASVRRSCYGIGWLLLSSDLRGLSPFAARICLCLFCLEACFRPSHVDVRTCLTARKCETWVERGEALTLHATNPPCPCGNLQLGNSENPKVWRLPSSGVESRNYMCHA